MTSTQFLLLTAIIYLTSYHPDSKIENFRTLVGLLSLITAVTIGILK